MADPNVRFIRVKGRIVPITKDKQLTMQLSKKKRERQAAGTASDFLQRGEATKELRKSAKDQTKQGARATKAATFSAIGSAIAGLGAFGLGKLGKSKGKYTLGALAAVGGANALAGLANRLGNNNAAKQYRKDASSIGKGKELVGDLRGWGSKQARKKSLFFQTYLADRQAPPPVPPPPMVTPSIAPPSSMGG